MTHVHCPECGFQNLESSKYCSKCGAPLIPDEPGGHTTMSFAPEELVDEDGVAVELPVEGTALIVRSGGGRQGEMFTIGGDRTTTSSSTTSPSRGRMQSSSATTPPGASRTQEA